MDHNFDNHPFGFRDYSFLGIRALVVYSIQTDLLGSRLWRKVHSSNKTVNSMVGFRVWV